MAKKTKKTAKTTKPIKTEHDYFMSGFDFEQEMTEKILDTTPEATNEQTDEVFFGALCSLFSRMERQFQKSYLLEYLADMPTNEEHVCDDCKAKHAEEATTIILEKVKNNTNLN